MIFALIPLCATYKKSFIEFINNLEILLGRLVINVFHFSLAE